MKPGDWVIDKEGYLFFIDECNTVVARVGCFVKKTEDSDIEIETELIFPEELKSTDLEGYSEEEITFLINLALDTNDKQWFDELTAKLKQLKVEEKRSLYESNGANRRSYETKRAH